ncbi:MAG: hypothetical protein WBL51_04955 [Acidimicrobiales bacterium]
MRQKFQFPGWVLNLAIGALAGALLTGFHRWFDRLTSLELFLGVFFVVALIGFLVEWLYRREYAQEYVSDSHLGGLKKTAQTILDGIPNRQGSAAHTLGKECQALFSHDREIAKETKWWDSEVSAWMQDGWSFNKGLAAALDANALNNYPFNRERVLSLISALCRDREMKFQAFGSLRQPFLWEWTKGEVVMASGRKNAVIIGDENGVTFIWDIDDPEHPIDVDECKRRLISIFDDADNSPTLKSWVKREITLSHDERVSSLRDRLHDFTLNDRLRTGSGCKWCNS